MNRKTQLQAELAALHKHSSCISNTNKELSVELESFVAADSEVQAYLNKKTKVESLKIRAEEELRMTMVDAQANKE